MVGANRDALNFVRRHVLNYRDDCPDCQIVGVILPTADQYGDSLVFLPVLGVVSHQLQQIATIDDGHIATEFTCTHGG